MAHNWVHKQQENASEIWGIITQRSRRNMPTQEMGTLNRVGHETLQGLSTYGEAIDWTNKQVSIGKALESNPLTYNISKQLRESKIGDDILNFSYHDARQGAVKWIGGKNQAAGVAANILMPDAVDFIGGVGYADNVVKAVNKYGPDIINRVKRIAPNAQDILKRGGDEANKLLDQAAQGLDNLLDPFGGAVRAGGDGSVMRMDAGRFTEGPRASNLGGDVGRLTPGQKATVERWDIEGAAGSRLPKNSVFRRYLTPEARDSDAALSKVVRYIDGKKIEKLDYRSLNAVASTNLNASPIKYLTKYSGNRIMNADSHHILDLEFWGKALNHPDADIISDTLWASRTMSGNAKRNIVWAWSLKSGGTDHEILHRLYDQLPTRNEIEALMLNGRWRTLKADTVAKYLQKLAYEQHRVTTGLFKAKLNLIKQLPEFKGIKDANKIREIILRNPKKYAELKLLDDFTNPYQIKKLLGELVDSNYAGKNNNELRTIFGLEVPDAGAKTYFGSARWRDFERGFRPRYNKAVRRAKGARDALKVSSRAQQTYQKELQLP